MSIVQVLIIAMILIVVLVVVAVFVLNQNVARKKRVMSVIRGTSASQAQTSEKGEQNKRLMELAKKLKQAEGEEGADQKKKTPISLQLEQAGLSFSVQKFWIFSFLSMALFVFLAKIMGQPIHILLLVAVIGLFGFPKLIIKKLTQKRQKNFLEEFPDALEATVRLLKAGMPVAEAIAMIAREFEGPVGDEMSRIYDKQKIGVSLAEAAKEATRRMPLTEMQMFATGLAIQAQTGSSLSEVLMNLSNVIRARFRLKRKIKALSSEAVASASIIGALPLLVTAGMYFTNPEYISILFTEPSGNFLLALAVTSMSVGVFVMKTMINFKV